MRNLKKYNTLEFHHRLAHRTWVNKVVLSKTALADNSSELVRQLILLYPTADTPFESVQDDIYATAYEIAQLNLDEMKARQVMEVFRDNVIESISQFTGTQAEQNQVTLKYNNVISDAITNASLSRLRHTLRTRQAESQASELRLAKRIQHTLLPKSIPELSGFEFAGRLSPADEVGGDYWSIKHHESTGIVTLKLADISGHGLAAATLVSAVKFISGGYYQGSSSASMVMDKTNKVLTRETPHEILVSMVYGWLNPVSHELTLVNAGLEPVFVCGTEYCTDVLPTGPVMGLNENTEYSEIKIQLKKGDIVFFGSDGITEAGIGEIFGIKRLKDLIMSNTHLSASELADLVVSTAVEYTQIQRDDISTLVMKVND